MKKIIKIVTFYEDGTFSESTPSPAYIPSVPMNPYPAPMPPYQPYPNPYPWPQVWCTTVPATVKREEE